MGNPKRQKTGGRQRGTPNRITGTLRARIRTLLDEQYESILEDFAHLEPKERISAWLRLLEYVLPKRREQQVIDVSKLTDDEVNELLEAARAVTDEE